MMNWSIREIHLPLKLDWALSRGTSTSKTNLIVEVGNHELHGMGEVAPNARYGESVEEAKAQFQRFLERLDMNGPNAQGPYSLEELSSSLDQVEIFPSLRFGIESAFLAYLSRLCEKPSWELLGTRQVNSIHTSFSLPLMPLDQIPATIQRLGLSRFSSLKIKLGREDALERVRIVRDSYKGKLCVDANEAWDNVADVLAFAEAAVPLELAFIEQPLPANQYDEYLDLKKHSPALIFADESLTTQEVTEEFARRFDGINVKLMKAGSYFRALRQLRDARRLGMYTMVGCMIETSLGISQAFAIADKVNFFDLDGHLLIDKDPFDILSEERGRLFFSKLH